MTLLRAIHNISHYRKHYGFSKAFRAVIHYSYLASKKIKPNSIKDNTIEVNGYKLAVMPGDKQGISSELLSFRTHEPVTTELVSQTIKLGMTCLDIGGNIGYYALLESLAVGQHGKVIAIEPSPDNFKYLQNNLKLQNATNVESFNFAAGNKNGFVNFLIYEETSNSCLVVPEGQEDRWPGKIIKVPVKQIDSFIDELGIKKIDFVRMDVEGYEFHILEGMRQTIQKFKPMFQIEVHKNIMGKNNTKKFIQEFQKNQYEVKYYIPRDLDVPLIGSLKDVKNYSFEKLLQMLDDETLPSFFMLTLTKILEKKK